MAQSEAHPSMSMAPHACMACRKQKRRCTKELPSCRLCTRLKRSCDYSDTSSISVSEDMLQMQRRIAELEAKLEQASSASFNDTTLSHDALCMSRVSQDCNSPVNGRDYLSMFFLDCTVFHENLLTVPKPTLSISSEIRDLVGSLDEILAVANKFFSETHLWLPFISRKRMELDLGVSNQELKADQALLLLAMRLINEQPQNSGEDPQSQLYWVVKNYFCVLESRGMISVQVLQASVLIAAYEIGHAIYPSAYLSPSKCARIGQALGLDDRQHTPQMLGKRPGAWAELEEMKRTWWAVMLLDRFVNLGIDGHTLATDEPLKSDVLPVGDSLWDLGEMSPGQPLYVASPTNSKAGPFARTCQASNLLGRYIRHRNDHTSEGPSQFSEAMQLHRTLLAFSNLLPGEFAQNPIECSTAMALCHTTLLHLYDPYACTEVMRGVLHCAEGTEMQTIAITGLKSTAANTLKFAEVMHSVMEDALGAISPLIIECLYSGAANYAWLVHEIGSPQMIYGYRKFVHVLEQLDRRWAVAGQYLKILEKTREVLYDNNAMLSTTGT